MFHYFNKPQESQAEHEEEAASPLRIGKPGDQYEREADSVAGQVMSGGMQAAGGVAPMQAAPPQISRMTKDAPAAPQIQQQAETTPSSEFAGGQVSQQLQGSQGKGAALDPGTRGSMESSMGADLSSVRIHTGAEATKMNEQMGSKAFTYGQDIYFNQGQYDPNTSSGQHLLAHELTHTVQQGHVGPDGGGRIQRAMKFELQTTNPIWIVKRDGSGSSVAPRKFGTGKTSAKREDGDKDFVWKEPRPDDAEREAADKERKGMELQTEKGGYVEFETPKWLRKWSKIKDRIQAAVDMTKAIDAPGNDLDPGNEEEKKWIDSIRGNGGTGGRLVRWPFDTSKTTALGADEALVVQVSDPGWGAKIQASEAIKLSDYQSLLEEHEYSGQVIDGVQYPDLVSQTKQNGNFLLVQGNKAKVPYEQLANLQGFLQMVMNYLIRLRRTKNLDEKYPSKFYFRLMARTSFSGMYSDLLSGPEKEIFDNIIENMDEYLPKLGFDPDAPVFPSGYGKYEPGQVHKESGKTYVPTIREFLKSIRDKGGVEGKDKLSPLRGGSAAMGRFDVRKEGSSKDLVRMEVRDTVARGGADGVGRDRWVKWTHDTFKSAYDKRNSGRDAENEQIYDPEQPEQEKEQEKSKD